MAEPKALGRNLSHWVLFYTSDHIFNAKSVGTGSECEPGENASGC